MAFFSTFVLFVLLSNQLYVDAKHDCPVKDCNPGVHLQERFCNKGIVVEFFVETVKTDDDNENQFYKGKVTKIYKGDGIAVGDDIEFVDHGLCVQGEIHFNPNRRYILSGILDDHNHFQIHLCTSILIRIDQLSPEQLEWIESLLKKLKGIGCKGIHHCRALPDIPANKDVKGACLFPATPSTPPELAECYLKFGACFKETNNCHSPCTWFFQKAVNCTGGDYEPDVTPP
ncbi:uncharacterized protein [Mytilus edulis]|uniref:uncharacterized protein n=1 Tax=Mytilus edulis TaxID=6550 RepID=UPI0039EE4698